MNVVHQFGFVLVEACVFSSFVSCAKYVFGDLVLLLIVDDGFGIAVGAFVSPLFVGREVAGAFVGASDPVGTAVGDADGAPVCLDQVY